MPLTKALESEKFLPPAACKHKAGDDEFIKGQNAYRERMVCAVGLDVHYELNVVAQETGAYQPRLKPFNPRMSGPACPYNYTGKFIVEHEFREVCSDPVALGLKIENATAYDLAVYRKHDPRLVSKTVVIRDYGCKIPIDLADTEKVAKAVLNHYPDQYVAFLSEFVSNIFGDSMRKHLQTRKNALQKLIDSPAEVNRVSWAAYRMVQGGKAYNPNVDDNQLVTDVMYDATMAWNDELEKTLNQVNTTTASTMGGSISATDLYNLIPCLKQHIETLTEMIEKWCKGFGTDEEHATALLWFCNDQGRNMTQDLRLLQDSDQPDYSRINLHVPVNFFSSYTSEETRALDPDSNTNVVGDIFEQKTTVQETHSMLYSVGSWTGSIDSNNHFIGLHAKKSPYSWGWGHPCNLVINVPVEGTVRHVSMCAPFLRYTVNNYNKLNETTGHYTVMQGPQSREFVQASKWGVNLTGVGNGIRQTQAEGSIVNASVKTASSSIRDGLGDDDSRVNDAFMGTTYRASTGKRFLIKQFVMDPSATRRTRWPTSDDKRDVVDDSLTSRRLLGASLEERKVPKRGTSFETTGGNMSVINQTFVAMCRHLDPFLTGDNSFSFDERLGKLSVDPRAFGPYKMDETSTKFAYVVKNQASKFGIDIQRVRDAYAKKPYGYRHVIAPATDSAYNNAGSANYVPSLDVNESVDKVRDWFESTDRSWTSFLVDMNNVEWEKCGRCSLNFADLPFKDGHSYMPYAMQLIALRSVLSSALGMDTAYLICQDVGGTAQEMNDAFDDLAKWGDNKYEFADDGQGKWTATRTKDNEVLDSENMQKLLYKNMSVNAFFRLYWILKLGLPDSSIEDADIVNHSEKDEMRTRLARSCSHAWDARDESGHAGAPAALQRGRMHPEFPTELYATLDPQNALRFYAFSKDNYETQKKESVTAVHKKIRDSPQGGTLKARTEHIECITEHVSKTVKKNPMLFAVLREFLVENLPALRDDITSTFDNASKYRSAAFPADPTGATGYSAMPNSQKAHALENVRKDVKEIPISTLSPGTGEPEMWGGAGSIGYFPISPEADPAAPSSGAKFSSALPTMGPVGPAKTLSTMIAGNAGRRFTLIPLGKDDDFNQTTMYDSAQSALYNCDITHPQMFAMLDAAGMLWHSREFHNPSDCNRPKVRDGDPASEPKYTEAGQCDNMHYWCRTLVESFVCARERWRVQNPAQPWECQVKMNPQSAFPASLIGSLCDATWNRYFPLLPHDHALRDNIRRVRAMNILWGTLPQYSPTQDMIGKTGAWMPLSVSHQMRLYQTVGLYDETYRIPLNPWSAHNQRGISRVFNQSYHSYSHTDSYRANHFQDWLKSACRYQNPHAHDDYCVYPFSLYGGTPVEADFTPHKVEKMKSTDLYKIKRHKQLVFNRFGFTKPLRIGQQYHDTGLLQDMFEFNYRSFASLSRDQRAQSSADAVYISNFMSYARTHTIIALASCNQGTEEMSQPRVVRNLYRLYVDTYECMGSSPDDDCVPVVMGFLPSPVNKKEDRPVTLFAGSLACLNSKLEAFCNSKSNTDGRVCAIYKQVYLNDATMLYTRMLRQERRKMIHDKNFTRALMKRGMGYTRDQFDHDLIDLQDAYIEFLQTTVLGMLVENGADLNGAPLHLLEPRELEVPLYEEDEDVIGNDYLTPRTVEILKNNDFTGGRLSRTQLAILSLIPPNQRIFGTLRHAGPQPHTVDMEHIRKQVEKETVESNKKVWQRYADALVSAAFSQKLLELEGEQVDFGLDLSSVQDPGKFSMSSFKNPMREAEKIAKRAVSTNSQVSSSVSQARRSEMLRNDKGPESVLGMNAAELQRALAAVKEKVRSDQAKTGLPANVCLQKLKVPDHIKRILKPQYDY